MTDATNLIGKNVVVKVDVLHFFFYNGKLVRETDSEYIIDDIKNGEIGVPKMKVVEIREMNQWDIHNNIDKAEEFMMGRKVRRLDAKLSAKWENLRKEFNELRKQMG